MIIKKQFKTLSVDILSLDLTAKISDIFEINSTKTVL